MENYTIEEKHKLLIGGIEVGIRSHGFIEGQTRTLRLMRGLLMENKYESSSGGEQAINSVLRAFEEDYLDHRGFRGNEAYNYALEQDIKVGEYKSLYDFIDYLKKELGINNG